MNETVDSQSFAYKQRWGEEAEVTSPVERSKVLTEHLQFRDAIGERDAAARKLVSTRLDLIFSDHLAKGTLRTGAALKAGVQMFDEHASHLIDDLVGVDSPIARNAEAFALMEACVGRFLTFLDKELERIVQKVSHEIQDPVLSNRFAQAAQRLWAEDRASLVGKLQRRRQEFETPPQNVETERRPLFERRKTEPTVSETVNVEPDIRQEDMQSDTDQTANPAPIAQHWHEMWAEIAARLWTGKLRPGARADLAQAMSEWFVAKEIDHSQAEVDGCARLLWLNHAATQWIKSSVSHGEAGRQAGDAAGFDWRPDGLFADPYSRLVNGRRQHPDDPSFQSCVAIDAQKGSHGHSVAAGHDGMHLTAPELEID